MAAPNHPVIEQLHVENYRVLRNITFDKLTPLTAFFGPNGSGKSTVFDVFAFLHEALTVGLRAACDARNRLSEIHSRNGQGPVVIQLKYREGNPALDGQKYPLIRYRLEIDESRGRPVVLGELLTWTTAPGSGRPRKIVDFKSGAGTVYDETARELIPESLESPDTLAVSALGLLTRHPQVASLRRFISGWYLSYISADAARQIPAVGPQELLSRSGDNLSNVLQHLQEHEPERLEAIFEALRGLVPQLDRLIATPLPDGRLMLQVKDRPFGDPILSRHASDGTLKLLAYLTVLRSAAPPAIIGIEEPENQLHPRLLAVLAEEMRAAATASQVLVTTHSPFFANALIAQELWLLYRDQDGFATTKRASGIPGVIAMTEAGGQLGDLWMEGYFGAGDPLRRAG